MKNIRDFGAVGDGKTLDTAAIQAAIDAGGTVYLPEGIYRTGTLYLRSNGGLHLAPGAVLLASHDRADYNADDFCIQNRVFSSEHVTGAHLIVAVECENVFIEGHGTIDGEGHFWMNEDDMYEWRGISYYTPHDERPAQMIFFCECENIHVSGVSIVNSPYWHLFFHGCEDVFVRGVRIKGDRPRWTNDGIDIDCCRRVTVSDCIIDVGDDAVAIRAFDEPLKVRRATEKVVISNCVLHSANDYGIRIGVGAGVIRDCVLTGLDIEAPDCAGIGVMGMWSERTRMATSVEGILGTNLSIRAAKPFEIFAAPENVNFPNDFHIDNLRFDNLILYPKEASTILGRKDKPLTNISISGVTVKYDGGFVGEAFRVENAVNCEVEGVKESV